MLLTEPFWMPDTLTLPKGMLGQQCFVPVFSSFQLAVNGNWIYYFIFI